MARNASASAKVILSGEYAIVFGHPGVAAPSPMKMHVSYEEGDQPLDIEWTGIVGNEHWIAYLKDVVGKVSTVGKVGKVGGKMIVDNHLPLGKGMGSSTALVIAVSRCLLEGDDEAIREVALSVEDDVNPGHSGMDFSVIWAASPIRFSKVDGISPVDLPVDTFDNTFLIDTGTPDQPTPELVAWVREREKELQEPLHQIANCTQRFLDGEPLRSILPDHHRAQVALGTVPENVQSFISEIESLGGAAKVLGAGSRTGGGGMVLVHHQKEQEIADLAKKHECTTV